MLATMILHILENAKAKAPRKNSARRCIPKRHLLAQHAPWRNTQHRGSTDKTFQTQPLTTGLWPPQTYTQSEPTFQHPNITMPPPRPIRPNAFTQRKTNDTQDTTAQEILPEKTTETQIQKSVIPENVLQEKKNADGSDDTTRHG